MAKSFTIYGTHVNQYSVYQCDVTVTGETSDVVIAYWTDSTSGAAQGSFGMYILLDKDQSSNATITIYNHRDVGNYSNTEQLYYDSTNKITFASPVPTPPFVSADNVVLLNTVYDTTYHSQESLLADARRYFGTHGQGTVTIDIPSNGASLTFTSSEWGAQKTVFVDSDTEVTLKHTKDVTLTFISAVDDVITVKDSDGNVIATVNCT